MFRRATETDIPVIIGLAQRIWWAHYPEIISDEQIEYMLNKLYNDAALQQQMAEGQVFRLVAPEEQPIGFVAVSDKGEGRYFIHKFYLEKTLQGRGVGSAVFQALLAEYPDAREIRLTVNRQNYKSINFYFKNGFVIEQNLDMAIGNGYFMNDFQMLWRPANTK